MTRPWVVLVAGGHAAGKKTVCKDLVEAVEKLSDGGISLHSDVVHLSDYKVGKRGPKAYDFEKLKQHLDSQEQQMIMVEGLYALYDQQLRDRAVMKVFVDSDADTRLSRWILRDTQGDSSKLGDVLEEYLNHARPEMLQSIQPTKDYADVILPRGSEKSGIDLIAAGIYDRIREEAPLSSDYAPMVAEKPINLRRESVQAQNQHYYDLN